MLDIKLIRDNPEEIKKKIAQKGADTSFIDQVLDLDQKRRKLLSQVEQCQSDLNRRSREIAEYHAQQKVDAINEASFLSERLKELKPKLEQVGKEYQDIINQIPNLPSDDTPEGKDELDNKVLRQWGDKPNFSFEPKEHWQIGEELDIIDISRAAKVSGSRFNYLKGKLALLEFALIQFAYSILTDEKKLKEIAEKTKLKVSPKPFIPVVPPVFIKPEIFQKMARLEPKEERYFIPSDNLYLIGSAEHTLGSIHIDETLIEKDLPLRYAGFSTSFRREAGSYGKDTKGILRVHQFDKLEIESFTLAKDASLEQDFIVAIQEYLMQELKIPYQVVQICTGEMSDPDSRQIDIESWLPGQKRYRETHTSDLMTDYQARRLNTRIKKKSGQTEFAYMNDATVFAIGRTLIALVENYQQKDGTIKIPEVLRKWTRFDKISKQ